MIFGNSITDVNGIKVGHWTDELSMTGCTVVICPSGTIGGVDVRGAAPGTRETDLLKPENSVQEVNAILLSGGSAFGLAAASGVVDELAENKIGFKVPVKEWFRNDLHDWVTDLLIGEESITSEYYDLEMVKRLLSEHKEEKKNHEKALWTMSTLEIFHRTNEGA